MSRRTREQQCPPLQTSLSRCIVITHASELSRQRLVMLRAELGALAPGLSVDFLDESWPPGCEAQLAQAASLQLSLPEWWSFIGRIETRYRDPREEYCRERLRPPQVDCMGKGIFEEIWSQWRNHQHSAGLIGATLGHILGWQRASFADRPTMFLEDDAKLSPSFASTVSKALQELDDRHSGQWDVLHLGARLLGPVQHEEKRDSALLCIPNFSLVCVGYILSVRGALKLMETLSNAYATSLDDFKFTAGLIPVDEMLGTLQSAANSGGHPVAWVNGAYPPGTLAAWVCRPMVVRERDALSSTD